MINEKMKRWIDSASYLELLRKWRYDPAGSPWFQGEIGEYYAAVMKKKREEIPREKQVAASKAID